MSELTLPHHHSDHDEMANLKACLDQTEHFQLVADVFKQLGDSTRIRIFWLLCHCEECVLDISAMMNMSSPAVSFHLRQLKASSFIESHRRGKEVYYKAANTKQCQLLHAMIEKLMEIKCPK